MPRAHAWGEIFGDDMAATTMIDRLIHHSEMLELASDHGEPLNRLAAAWLALRTFGGSAA